MLICELAENGLRRDQLSELPGRVSLDVTTDFFRCIDPGEKGRLAGGTLRNSLNTQTGISRDTGSVIRKFHILFAKEAQDLAVETGEWVGFLVSGTNANSVDKDKDNIVHSFKRTFLFVRG